VKTNRLPAVKPCLCAVALWLAFCGAAAAGADEAGPLLDAGLPVTRLFDTGAPLPDPLPASPETAAWTLVPEGAAAHAFRGDAVALNDRIALVVRKGAAGAQLYSRSAQGLRLRATLSPLAADGPRTVGAVSVAENGPGAVALQAAFSGDGPTGSAMTFRITTGDVKVEARGPAGADGLRVRCDARYVVVPDFFANDMVFEAGAFDARRVGLPAENFLLGLLGGSDCILMCVWDSAGRDADMLVTQGSEARAIDGWEIAPAEGGRTWLAVLDGPGAWHARGLPDQEGAPDLALDWTPPFPARWRADLLGAGPLARSLSLRDDSDAEAEDSAGPACACSVADGRTLMRLPAAEAAGHVVIYPIDRSRATPLNAFCPIDVVRSTLGVGPCQYILAMEGLDPGTHPTPADVTHWVERQFERGRDARQARAIRERLERMVEHVEHTQERIGRYGEFAREVRDACAERGRGPAAHAAELLGRTAADMARAVGSDDGAAAAADKARRLAEGIVALIGQEGAPAECAKLGAELRALGAAQDRALAGGRMTVRWLRQQCRMLARTDPAGAELAEDVQARAEAMLRQQ